MFSLCIPTMDRFDKFLNNYLDKYITNTLIDEIIITDENGNDIKQIKNKYGDNAKLVLLQNESKLGPFLNKLKACSYAKNEWIVLMDSDNFADLDYFETAKQYIETKLDNQKNIILAPSKARPNFDYSHLSGFIYKKGLFESNLQKENSLKKHYNTSSRIMINTGNYVLNKYLIDNLNISSESENIKQSSSCDVIYFNLLLFQQLDLNLHIVPNLEYEHVVHNGSVYIQTYQQYYNFANYVYNKYDSLK
jgi:hypothetical protein